MGSEMCIRDRYKIMPSEPGEEFASKIVSSIQNSVKSLNATLRDYKIEPLAFGLYTIKVLFTVPEEDNRVIDSLENILRNISGVSSIEVVGMTRL